MVASNDNEMLYQVQLAEDNLHLKIHNALQLAHIVHFRQKDKIGEPYLMHIIGVSAILTEHKYLHLALIHDVLEDSEFSLEDVKASMGYLLTDEDVDALIRLTKKEGERYFDYIERIKGSAAAVCVKVADLRNNLNPNRIELVRSMHGNKFDSLFERYEIALKQLLKVLVDQK